MITIILLCIGGIALISFLVSLSTKSDNKRAIKQLAEILSLFGKENEAVNMTSPTWKGKLCHTEVELEYFTDYRISNDTLSIKIPFRTRKIFFLKNISRNTPFDKKSFIQANEVCLNYIHDKEIRERISAIMEDLRFSNFRTRMNSYASKFVELPGYDQNNNIQHDMSDKETDALSIMLTRPSLESARNAENDFDYEFLNSMILLLADVKVELEKELVVM